MATILLGLVAAQQQSVPLVLIAHSVKCLDKPTLSEGRLAHARQLLARYRRDVPQHRKVDLHLVSDMLTCADMACRDAQCQCTHVPVPEEFLRCSVHTAESVWKKFPARSDHFEAFNQDSAFDKLASFVKYDAFPGMFMPARFGPAMLKLQLHKILKLDRVIVSDIDVAFLSEIGSAMDALDEKKDTRAMIAAVPDPASFYDEHRHDVMHPREAIMGGLLVFDLKAMRQSNFDAFLKVWGPVVEARGPLLLPEQDLLNEYAALNPGAIAKLSCGWAWSVPFGHPCRDTPKIFHGFRRSEETVARIVDECARDKATAACVERRGRALVHGRQSYASGTAVVTFSFCDATCSAATCAAACASAVAQLTVNGVAPTCTCTCGVACGVRGRQIGQVATTTVSQLSTAQAQTLVNLVAAGQVVAVPPSAASSATVQSTPTSAPAPLPANSDPVPASNTTINCANTAGATQIGPCVRAGCDAAQIKLIANGFRASCCLCPGRQTTTPSLVRLVSSGAAPASCAVIPTYPGCSAESTSKKGLLGLLGLLGLIPLLLLLLCCALCFLRRRRRGPHAIIKHDVQSSFALPTFAPATFAAPGTLSPFGPPAQPSLAMP